MCTTSCARNFQLIFGAIFEYCACTSILFKKQENANEHRWRSIYDLFYAFLLLISFVRESRAGRMRARWQNLFMEWHKILCTEQQQQQQLLSPLIYAETFCRYDREVELLSYRQFAQKTGGWIRLCPVNSTYAWPQKIIFYGCKHEREHHHYT